MKRKVSGIGGSVAARGVVAKGLLAVLVGLASACGPSISTQVRYDMQAFDQNENKQTKDGITVENKPVKEMPANFYATVEDCTRPPNQDGSPAMTNVQFPAVGQLWYQVAITNDTEHVVRLNSVIVRLFDPAGNQWESLTKDELVSEFQVNFPCPSGNKAVSKFRSIKLIERNAEILPHTTITGWLAFKPTDWRIPGMWKLAVYEVPIATDDAGKVTKTTRFEFRQVVKKFIDTYRQEGMFSSPKLVDTKEVTD